jgi:hypothetical protein
MLSAGDIKRKPYVIHEGKLKVMRNTVIRISTLVFFSGLMTGCPTFGNNGNSVSLIPPTGGSNASPGAVVDNSGLTPCSSGAVVVNTGVGNCASPASSVAGIPSTPASSAPGVPAASPVSGNVASAGCKRGIAWAVDTIADAKLLSKSVTWWYNWSPTPQAAVSGGLATVGMQFIPMLWNGSGIGTAKPAAAPALLGFNEPDLGSQANMTPQNAASLWPQVESLAKAQNIPLLISPAVAFSVSWMQQFMSLCTGCKVDGIAFHTYTDNATDVQNEVKSFEQFNKPIWLTEFACHHNASNTSCTLSETQAFMNSIIPWLESQPQVARYAWFSGTNVPNSVIIQNGQLTTLGQSYVAFPGTCS